MDLNRRVEKLEQQIKSTRKIASYEVNRTFTRMLNMLPEHHRRRMEQLRRLSGHTRLCYGCACLDLWMLSKECVLEGKPFPSDGGLSIVEERLKQ